MNEVFLPPAELKPPPNTPMLPIEEKEATERKPPVPEVAEPSQPDQVMESESEIHTSEIE